MTDAIAVLTPEEIAANLRDAGRIDYATAALLEQRIVSYARRCALQAREEGRIEGITEAVKKAEAAAGRIRGDRQKEGAAKALWAVRGLLPPEAAARHDAAQAEKRGYARGYQDGKHSRNYRERNPRGAR